MSKKDTTPRWMFRQSGVIPYRFKQGVLEILLITSQHRKRWVIPKGVIEPDLTAVESAIQEAWEEAGLTGRASEQTIGSYIYYKWGGICHVEVFLFEVKTAFFSWPEDDLRDRVWLSVEEASRRVEEEDLKKLILAVPKLVDTEQKE